MFKLNTSPSYKWPVAFTTIDDDGNVVNQQFTAIFKRMPRENALELGSGKNNGTAVSVKDLQDLRILVTTQSTEELIDQIDGFIENLKAVKTGSAILDNDVETIMQFMVGWEDVDINGSSDFNADSLRLMLNGVPNIQFLISKAFFDSNVAGDHVRKNSKMPRATGR